MVIPNCLTFQFGMTKPDRQTKADRAKPGPKPKPPEERVIKTTVSLKPATYDGLRALGDGVLSKGIEAMYASTTKRRKRAA